MRIGETAAAVGKGLFAGGAGTAAMTLSSSVEAKLRERGASNAPAEAAGKVLGVEPRDEDGQIRFSNLVHWGYGTCWGAMRGCCMQPASTAARRSPFTSPPSGAPPR